jgi:hypothetical protein
VEVKFIEQELWKLEPSDDAMKEHLLLPESSECSVESHNGSDDGTTGDHANQVPNLASLYYWPHQPNKIQAHFFLRYMLH